MGKPIVCISKDWDKYGTMKKSIFTLILLAIFAFAKTGSAQAHQGWLLQKASVNNVDAHPSDDIGHFFLEDGGQAGYMDPGEKEITLSAVWKEKSNQITITENGSKASKTYTVIEKTSNWLVIERKEKGRTERMEFKRY